jgi:ribonuclease P protein component
MPARRQPGMRQKQRLTKRRDFTAVYRKGRALAHPLLVLRLLPNELPYSRYGFVVSKSVGKAVVRNLVRRRLREGVRTLLVQPGWDIVFLARPKAAAADFQTLRRAAASLLSRAKLLTSPLPAGETGPAGMEIRKG